MEAQIAQLKLAQRTNQLVIVIAEAVEAEVSFWEKQDAKWRMKLQTKGYVGEAGIGNAREGSKVTPEGAFRLGQLLAKKTLAAKRLFGQSLRQTIGSPIRRVLITTRGSNFRHLKWMSRFMLTVSINMNSPA